MTLLAPVILRVEPAFGPVGTPVVISGRNLAPGTLAFNRTLATIDSVSDTEIRTTVPLGASSGPIALTTGTFTYGIAPSAFTVSVAGGSLDVWIAGLYLTQATQTLARAVPLVQGRDAYLRVFPQANQANSARPEIQVRLRSAAGTEVLNEIIEPPGQPVPLEVDEGASGWGLAIPGALIQPGLTVTAELLLPGIALLDPTPRRYPADGSALALEVQAVAPVAITIFPVQSGASLGSVRLGFAGLERWPLLLQKVFPVNDLDLQQGPVFVTTANLDASLDSYQQVLAELQANLATLAVRSGSRQLATLTSSAAARPGARLAAAPLRREPLAMAWRPGIVHLGWDAGSHPLVAVRDGDTGQVLGFAKDGSADLATSARNLELLLSDGLRTTVRSLTVTD